MVNDSVFETAQFFEVIDWFMFYANSTRKFDRSCLRAVLGIHAYLVMLLTSKADRLFFFYEQYSLYDDNLLSGI